MHKYLLLFVFLTTAEEVSYTIMQLELLTNVVTVLCSYTF